MAEGAVQIKGAKPTAEPAGGGRCEWPGCAAPPEWRVWQEVAILGPDAWEVCAAHVGDSLQWAVPHRAYRIRRRDYC